MLFARTVRRGAALLIALLALAGLLGASFAGVVAAAPTAATESATVLDVIGSDKIVVQTDAGATLRVQYIGVRGPVRSSVYHADARAFHAPLVVNRRVVLESEGKDEEEGYKLRHVSLEGSPAPVAVELLGSGWAVAAPYPVVHRHRGFYLQLNEQAMVQQVNLWQPGIMGPAVPWRPTGDEAGYVAADPDLHPALDLLYTVPTGQSILNRLVRTAPTLRYRKLREGIGGYAEPRMYSITISRGFETRDPRALAAVIAHEGTHAIDFATGNLDLTSFSCFEFEQRAHGIQAQVWSEFYGPEGKPNPGDIGDHSNNAVLRFARRGDLANYVQRSAGYEAQCAAERPSS